MTRSSQDLPCPVADAGTRIVRLIKAMNDIDAQLVKKAGAECPTRLRRKREVLEDRLFFMEETVMASRAMGLTGVISQVLISLAYAERIRSCVPEDLANDADRWIIPMRAAQYSMLDALATAAGVRWQDIATDYYATAELDPHRVVEEAETA